MHSMWSWSSRCSSLATTGPSLRYLSYSTIMLRHESEFEYYGDQSGTGIGHPAKYETILQSRMGVMIHYYYCILYYKTPAPSHLRVSHDGGAVDNIRRNANMGYSPHPRCPSFNHLPIPLPLDKEYEGWLIAIGVRGHVDHADYL
jgi:hypothetical protein